MQFKSIVAVFALAVAVIATPVDPAAVKLVERTTPTTTTTTTTQALCNQSNQVATSCKFKGVQQSADQVVTLLASLVSILNPVLSLLNNAKILDNLTCVVQGNNIPIASGQKALCCTNPGGNSNNQSGNLIALNVQSSCSAVQAV